MKIQQKITRILSSILAVLLCVGPQPLSVAQQSNPPAQPQSSGTTVDPSKAPLQPVTTYPEAPAPQQDRRQYAAQPLPRTTTAAPTPQEQKPSNEPVGSAAAEKVPTAGGAATTPAGEAIAPAKQHQTRSLFLKIGAIAAGGLAAGTIYALSRGTSSKPPGSGQPGVTQK
jgi:hypothetical protein